LANLNESGIFQTISQSGLCRCVQGESGDYGGEGEDAWGKDSSPQALSL